MVGPDSRTALVVDAIMDKCQLELWLIPILSIKITAEFCYSDECGHVMQSWTKHGHVVMNVINVMQSWTKAS